MKVSSVRLGLFTGAAVLLATACVWSADEPELKDQKQKFSYAVGMNLATSWKKQEIDIDLDTLVRGLKDATAGKTVLTESEARDAITVVQKELRAKAEEKRKQQEEARKQQGEKNKTEGAAFLAENKAKPGVTTLPSGLQYKVLTEGSGESPKATDVVTVNYKGTLTDGTEFDSSYTRGQPATFALNGVIKGWTEAVQLMKPGAKWQIVVPSDLAYGERGSGAKIAPNATLVFEIELISFKAQPAPAPTASAAPQPVTSDIIRVPSAEELKAGAKPEVIKASDLEKYKKAEQEKAQQANPPK